ncbi:MAG TPA: hypothetical protein DCP28_04930, partial [Cytophagales bacterium]|nr:hypothetical protein [Cytophagales bacterium]
MKRSNLLLLLLSLLSFACHEYYTDLGENNLPETCVSRPLRDSVFDGVFYEIIDRGGLEVWGTNEFTEESFAEFRLPTGRFLWEKNSPREGFIDSMQFARSPGCDTDGLYTYKQMFGRDWLKVVQLIALNQRVPDTDNLLRVFELEKYHRVRFYPGKRVILLVNPEGEQFISLTRDASRTQEDATLPTQRAVHEHT